MHRVRAEILQDGTRSEIPRAVHETGLGCVARGTTRALDFRNAARGI